MNAQQIITPNISVIIIRLYCRVMTLDLNLIDRVMYIININQLQDVIGYPLFSFSESHRAIHMQK